MVLSFLQRFVGFWHLARCNQLFCRWFVGRNFRLEFLLCLLAGIEPAVISSQVPRPQGRRNRGGGGKAPHVFRRHKKCPFSGGKVPFAFTWKMLFRLHFWHTDVAKHICESLWFLECGAVKQWETMTSLLGAHSLAANRTFQNRKAGWSTTNGKTCTLLVCKNNCKLL